MQLRLLASLRNQVLLLLILSMVPIAGLTVYLSLEDERQAEADATEAARATVQQTKDTVGYVLTGTRDMLMALGTSPVLAHPSPGCFEYLRTIAQGFPHLLGIGVTDEDGRRLCSSTNGERLQKVRMNPDHADVVRRVRAVRYPVVASVSRNPATGRAGMPVVGPVIGADGEVNAFLSAPVDLNWLQERIARLPIASGGSVVVFGRDGRLLGRSPSSARFPPGTPVPAFERSVAETVRNEGQIEEPGVGLQFVYTSRLSPEDGITVVFKIPARTIFRDSRQKLWLNGLGLGLVGLTSFALIWFGSGRLVARPLRMLNEAARRLGTGDASARSGLSYSGEIGAMAQAFDQMAAALQEARDRNDQADAILRSILYGTSTSTGEEFFQSLVLSLTTALHADMALVGEIHAGESSVECLSICHQGRIVDNVTYRLVGTPCENVMREIAVCHYRSGVQEIFPNDRFLTEFSIQSYMGTPLCDELGVPVGILAVLHSAPLPERVVEADSMLMIFASRAAAELKRLRIERELRTSIAERNQAVEQNERMVAVLRELTARLQSVREEERTAISREIHDELGQQLTVMRFDISAIQKQVREMGSSATAELLMARVESLRAALGATSDGVRRISSAMRPNLLDTFGPVAAIQWLAEQVEKGTGVACRVESPEEITVSDETAITLFRICQESLTNMARHSRATKAEVRIDTFAGHVQLEVSDNGVGIRSDTLSTSGSLGVLGMQERVRMLQGTMEIGNGRLGGVTVSAVLPNGRNRGVA